MAESIAKSAPECKARTQVSAGIFQIFGFSILCIAACQTVHKTEAQRTLVLPVRSQWQSTSFVAHTDWLGESLDFKPINSLRQQLEAQLGHSLQNRGEAHITLITPPEYNVLKDKLSIDAINAIADRLEIQRTVWNPICLGQVSNPKNPQQVAYFVVVESEGFYSIRQEIYRAFTEKGGNPLAFQPRHFNPHITVGFTEKDLYEQDGISKDSHSCSYSLVTH